MLGVRTVEGFRKVPDSRMEIFLRIERKGGSELCMEFRK
jgi:hypothetical protein